LKFQLTGREKSELFGEAIVTIIVMLLLNMSIFLIIDQLIDTNPGIENGIFQIKMSLSFGPQHIQFWSWGWAFTLLMLIGDTFVIYWRLTRRYRQMQLRHVIVELHYIASGHFDHRIPFTLSGQMQRVVESVNALVDSTITSLEEERAIERSKDELITNVSHDIRTPLTSIIGYLGLIEDQQYQSKEDLLKYTHTAFLKSKQMKSLVDDLFEYTKVQQTDAKLETVQIDLNAMLEQLGASFELEASKKGMKITVNVGTTPLMFDADPEKLARVFNNLVSNALKYGHGGKNIYLSAKKVSNREVEVVVANDGEPIPQSDLRQIFERFYRVEGSRSKETGGTGLGLAIALGIVELHHGYIYASSDEQITKFTMHFPIKHSDTLKAPEKCSASIKKK
jgi:signal transduction histidine kinase